MAGDRNFGEDRPNVWSDVRLCLSDDHKTLELKIDSIFEEDDAGSGNSDNNTRGEVNLRKVIYTAPQGFSIDEILSETAHQYHYLDTDKSVDVSPNFLNELVYQYRIMGDTNDSDLPSNNNPNGAEGYSYWSAEFNDICLRIKQD